MPWIALAIAMGALGAPQQNAAELADAAFQNGEWEAAVAHYESAAAEGELESMASYQLGYAHYRLGNCRAALDAYSAARDEQSQNARLFGTAALCAARLDRLDAALVDLETAIGLGAPPAVLLGDASFDAYAEDPRVAELTEKYDRQSRPCMYDPTLRQFDFWLGEWDVHAGGGGTARSSITLEEQGCVIRETYAAGIYGGTSVNYVDRASGRWRQTWTDNLGVVTHFEGDFVDGEMRFVGTSIGIGGGETEVEMTFSQNDDGSVRQFIRTSTDGGETWTVGFDGRYVKRTEE